MKEMDCVEVTVEKGKTPQYGTKRVIAAISAKEEEMKLIAGMDAGGDEQSKTSFRPVL